MIIMKSSAWRKLDTRGFIHILFLVLMVKSLKTVSHYFPISKAKFDKWITSVYIFKV